jgi:hypothetical protein
MPSTRAGAPGSTRHRGDRASRSGGRFPPSSHPGRANGQPLRYIAAGQGEPGTNRTVRGAWARCNAALDLASSFPGSVRCWAVGLACGLSPPPQNSPRPPTAETAVCAGWGLPWYSVMIAGPPLVPADTSAWRDVAARRITSKS